MPSIEDLPLEILDLVANLISLHDIIACLLVNHEWHDVFERVLYQSVDTRQREKFLAFMQRLDGTAQSPLPLGHCVRELKICDGFMTCKRMNQLLELCPYVNSLTFRWQDSKAHETHITSTKGGATRRYFGTPARIMKMFPRITQLTLECEPKNRRNGTILQYGDVSLYLDAAQNLRSLVLHGVPRKLTYSQLDMAHKACPNLMHLKITISTINYATYGDMMDTPDEVSAESDTRISDLDGPLWPAKAARMQHFEVCDESTVLDIERYIRYAAAMYPRLRIFCFSNWCWERSILWSDNSKPQNWRFDGDKRLLAERCPELHTVEMSSVPLPKEAIYQIFSGSALNKIAIKGERADLMDAEGYKAIMNVAANKVSRLRLAVPPRSMGELFTDATMCDRLVELELMYFSSARSEKAPNVRIDSVLLCCPALKDLTLMQVHANAGFSSRFTSGLTTLRLHRVDLRCGSLLRFVSKTCPQLSHLHMYQCITTRMRLGPQITLDFASHHFKSLCIYDHKSNEVLDNTLVGTKLYSISMHRDITQRDVYLLPHIVHPLLMNYRSLEFDDASFTDPYTTGRFIKLNAQQVSKMVDVYNRLEVSLGKRKRENSEQRRTSLERFKFEMDKGGCFSIRCSSVAKVVVNGVYLVRNGTCLQN